MVAVEEDHTLPSPLEILQANSTALLHASLNTNMAILHWKFVATLTFIAVEACLATANSADPALLAMVDAFLHRFVIVEGTHGTIIVAKGLLTVLTSGRLWL